MLQNSAQVTLCPGVHLGVQHIISSLSILNFGISITNMEVAMLVYFAAPEGPLQVGLFICKQSAVFSENLSIRTVKTRYQSVCLDASLKSPSPLNVGLPMSFFFNL